MSARTTIRRALLATAAAVAAVAASAAHAHRPWLLPSATQVDAAGAVVSVDAAVSEDLFEFDTSALDLDELVVTAPDGGVAKAEGRVASKRRVSFEVKLAQPGSYRIAGVSDTVVASWKVGGETRRWRGAPAALAAAVPADAHDVAVSRTLTRVETFVSIERPGPVAPAAAGLGLELQPLDVVTDLCPGDRTRLRLLLDGRPLADADVTVIRGGNRYRDRLGEIALRTDADGAFAVTWPDAGRWWLGANQGARAPGSLAAPARRAGYTATFEVRPR